jgi:peptidoglycan/xylan/chitin deacetylase (PgdA/CDA1 family)
MTMAMRIRLVLAAGAVATLALLIAGCSPLRNAEATPAAQRHATRVERTTARSSTVWKFAPSLLGAEWEQVPTTGKLVALTFDAGSGDQGLASILATLEDKNVTATFFLTGKWAESFSADAKEIAAHYAIGNHTYSHPEDLLTLPDAEVVSEVERGAASIRNVTQVDPRPLFRFPYGSRDARTIGSSTGSAMARSAGASTPSAGRA